MSHFITFTVQTTVHISGFLRNNKVILTPLSALKSPAWEQESNNSNTSYPPVVSCSSGGSRKVTERKSSY